VILPVQWQPRQLSSNILNGITSAAKQWQSNGRGIVSKLTDTDPPANLPPIHHRQPDLPASLPPESLSVASLPLASLSVLDARLPSAQQDECPPFQEGTNYHTSGIDVKHKSGLSDATSCSRYCHRDASYFTFGTADPFTGMCWCKNDNRVQQVLKSVTSGTSCPTKNGTASLAHKFRGHPLTHAALIQRKASRYFRRGEPQNIEDVNFIFGVPKIVWVILANVLAMAAWMGCIAAGLYLSRQPGNGPQNEDWERVSANNEAFVRDYREEYGFIPQPFSPLAPSSGLLAQRPVYGDSQKYITGNSFYDQRHTAYDVPQITSTGPTPTFFGGDEQFQDMRRQLRV
jgi:hypothetical protein